jgi:hypothetical protein
MVSLMEVNNLSKPCGQGLPMPPGATTGSDARKLLV